jgi:hypothetical protein
MKIIKFLSAFYLCTNCGYGAQKLHAVCDFPQAILEPLFDERAADPAKFHYEKPYDTWILEAFSETHLPRPLTTLRELYLWDLLIIFKVPPLNSSPQNFEEFIQECQFTGDLLMKTLLFIERYSSVGIVDTCYAGDRHFQTLSKHLKNLYEKFLESPWINSNDLSLEQSENKEWILRLGRIYQPTAPFSFEATNAWQAHILRKIVFINNPLFPRIEDENIKDAFEMTLNPDSSLSSLRKCFSIIENPLYIKNFITFWVRSFAYETILQQLICHITDKLIPSWASEFLLSELQKIYDEYHRFLKGFKGIQLDLSRESKDIKQAYIKLKEGQSFLFPNGQKNPLFERLTCESHLELFKNEWFIRHLDPISLPSKL